MTIQNGLIGLGSGAASALLFASLTSGSYLSIALFYLAPLPLMIGVAGGASASFRRPSPTV